MSRAGKVFEHALRKTPRLPRSGDLRTIDPTSGIPHLPLADPGSKSRHYNGAFPFVQHAVSRLNTLWTNDTDDSRETALSSGGIGWLGLGLLPEADRGAMPVWNQAEGSAVAVKNGSNNCFVIAYLAARSTDESTSLGSQPTA
jgi:hypothetical protein